MSFDKFFIEKEYTSRKEVIYFDDTKWKDEYQNEVYLEAKIIADKHQYVKIFDYGCGSGFKTFKFFGDSKYLKFLCDFEKTLNFIKKEYSESSMLDSCKLIDAKECIDFSNFKNNVDILILADVIEHVDNPIDILKNIESISPKCIVISTPCRGFRDSDENDFVLGPPKNEAHIREWRFDQFQLFLSKYLDKHYIYKHYISNEEQRTQCVIMYRDKIL